MARYIDDILQPGEKVLYSTNAHWIFYMPAIAAWVAVLILLVLSGTASAVPSLMLVCWASAAVVAIAALYWTFRAWFHRFTTETDVTNMRVVHNTGLTHRRPCENYGNVTINGVGEGKETIRTIASPLAFRSAITTR